MKALVAQALTGTSGLAYADVDEPVSGDAVIIDVGAAGVCFPDLLLLRGEYQMRLDPPFIPGMEVAGTVRSAPESSGFAPGQRVSAFTMIGGYAEQVAALPDNVIPTPENLDDASAAALLGNYYTTQFALARRGALVPGETVLVLGSAGGIGTASIQLAKAHGAGVIAMVHRAGAEDFVSGLGADVVLPLTDGWRDAVLAATDGRGVDLVVDPIGGPAFDDAVRVLAPEGRLLVIGFAAGAGILLRNVSVVGVGWGEFVRRNPGAQAAVGAELGKLVADGLRPPPPVRYRLADGAAALDAMAAGEVRGKLVLEP